MYLMQMRWLILDECIDIEYQIRENLSKIHQSSREARWNVGEVKGLPPPLPCCVDTFLRSVEMKMHVSK